MAGGRAVPVGASQALVSQGQLIGYSE